jgi:hypothetical protein
MTRANNLLDMSQLEVSDDGNNDERVPGQVLDEALEEMGTSPKFTIFPRFPPEIRHKIWRLACCERRVVEVYACKEMRYTSVGNQYALERNWRQRFPLYSKTKNPPLFQTCSESRDIAMSTYKTNLGNISGRGFLSFDFDFDTAYLGRPFLEHFKENHRRGSFSIWRDWQESSLQNPQPREVDPRAIRSSEFSRFTFRNLRSVAVDAACMMHSTQGYLDRNKYVYHRMVTNLCSSLWECLKVLVEFENLEEIIFVLNKDICGDPDLSGSIHLEEMDVLDDTPLQILQQEAISVLELHLQALRNSSKVN